MIRAVCIMNLMLVLFQGVMATGALPSQSDYVFPDEQPAVALTGWRTAAGDDPAWASADFNDSAWPEDPGWGMWAQQGHASRGVRWYRKKIFFPEPPDSLTTLALYQVAIVSANQIYWDGTLIAANGVVSADSVRERSGSSGSVFPIPRNLSGAGEHVLALRVSNHRAFSGLIDSPLLLGTTASLYSSLFRRAGLMLFLAGVFLVSALFHVAVMFGQSRRRTYGIFSGFCCAGGLYLLIRTLLDYLQIDLDAYFLLAALNDIPWLFMLVLLPLFFLLEFSFPVRRVLGTLVCCAATFLVVLQRLSVSGLLSVQWLNTLGMLQSIYLAASVVLSLIVCLWAWRARLSGAVIGLCGLLLFTTGVGVSIFTGFENGWAVGLASLIVLMTIALSRQLSRKNRQHQEAQLRSARLELELLKKHIQPHFLLNSLNSIMAWLEEEPATAARLVNALADELRMLMQFSGKNRIPLNQEIALCQSHLQVMSLRMEKAFCLDITGDCRGIEVPPLVVHTLVENGLTHGFARREQGRFELNCIQDNGLLRLRLFNDGDVAPVTTRPGDQGTGLKYVKSRLQECWPGRWQLDAGSCENGYAVQITVEAGG